MSKKQNKRYKVIKQQTANLKLCQKNMQLKVKALKHELFKQLNLRNMKVFVNTCNFLMPFMLTAGITVGIFKVCNGGFPFYTDTEKKVKQYDLKFVTDSYIEMHEGYVERHWWSNMLPKSKITIYTPWQIEDGEIKSFKMNYIFDDVYNTKLYEAVLSEDYDYIIENMAAYLVNQEMYYTSQADEGDDYIIEACLHSLDKLDRLEYPETELKNNIITLIESIVTLGIGGVIVHFRKFNTAFYIDKVKTANEEYKVFVIELKQKKKELAEIKKEVNSLKRTLRRK